MGYSAKLRGFTILEILVVIAVIAIITGGMIDAAVILGVVIINSAIGFVTERQAEKTISSLSDTGVRSVRVLRNGVETDIDVEDIVHRIRPAGDALGLGREVTIQHLFEGRIQYSITGFENYQTSTTFELGFDGSVTLHGVDPMINFHSVSAQATAEEIAKMDDVVVSRDYLFMCSDPGQELIESDIGEQNNIAAQHPAVVADMQQILAEASK